MRRSLLAGVCLLISYSVFAQNKTLGVGVASPNPNAALHVESPTGNQGFIMPRLTTPQRETMTSLLTEADKGLMLYDSDQYAIYIWDGASWGKTSEFIIDNPASTDDAITTLNLGAGHAGRFTINNTSTFAHAILAETNGDSTSAAVHGLNTGQGFGLFGQSSGSKFASAAVYGLHVGTGDAAGAFRISNSANTYSALFGETNGSGPAVYGNQIGTGRGAQFQITNASNTQAAIRGYTTGTGNVGFFTVNNASADSSALFTTTNGIGNAITALTTGGGSAGRFVVNNPENGKPVVWAETNSNQPLSAPIYGLNNGTGDVAGSFRIANASNGFPAVLAETMGTGRAATFRKHSANSDATVYVDAKGGHGLWSDNYGKNGHAAIIQNVDIENAREAMMIEAVGPGASLWALKSTDAVSGDALKAENWISSGSAANFAITDGTNTSSTLHAETAGQGSAGYFYNSNIGSGAATIFTQTDGTGAALQAETSTGFAAIYGIRGGTNGNAARFENTSTQNMYPAVQVNHVGPGSGININQSGSTGDAIYAQKTSGIGSAVAASNEANGIAFAAMSGGIKIVSVDVNLASIQTRASAYRIVAGGPDFSLDFGPTDGEVFMIYNDTPGAVTVQGISILPSEGKTLVVFPGGVIRGF